MRPTERYVTFGTHCACTCMWSSGGGARTGAAGMAALPRLTIFGDACRAASREAIAYIPGRIHFVTWPITPSGAIYIAQARHDPREVPVVLTECHAYKDPKA